MPSHPGNLVFIIHFNTKRKSKTSAVEEEGDRAELSTEGNVTGESGIRITPPRGPEQSRQWLSYALVGLLAVTIVGHYDLLILEWNGKKKDPLANAFNTSLPV